MEQLSLAFITGVTTGGISCMAVQGGLLSSGLASQTQNSELVKTLSKTQYILLFLGSKIAAMALLGFLLGSFGSVFQISVQAQALLQIALGLFMLATVGNLLHLHPLFRYAVIQPPKALFRFLRRFSKTDHDIATPLVLGFGTIFIPCGVTQLMMASAVASGSPLLGAGILAAFALGTSPLFFTLGYTTAKFLTHKLLILVPALIISYFGITSIDAGLTLANSPYTLKNFYQALTTESTPAVLQAPAPLTNDGKQDVIMTVSTYEYTTNYTTLKAGVPVKLTINSYNAQGCIRAFTIPSMNLTKVLPETGTEILEFTPTKTGKLTYSCNMGMYTGEFNVIM